ncbi:MAG: M67 family metallopeptidase [Anaerolineales bacterium]|nr:M67 family metallopeptidase [Anaerolineales bacterium]MDW8161385.1 M67 family metallopeptidase [Anaerolineales bacterium]
MKTLVLAAELLQELSSYLEGAYPEEGAGFLLGKTEEELGRVQALFPLPNAREAEARSNRFLLTPQDYVVAELHAEQSGLEILGVFHSHPDCPNTPSEFDRQWALPHLVYLITTVSQGKAANHRAWMLREDRSAFDEITLELSTRPPFLSTTHSVGQLTNP